MNAAQTIVLRRQLKVFVTQGNGCAGPEFVASLNKNLETISFTFSAQVIQRLQSWTPEQLLDFAESLLPRLLKMAGGDV